MTFGEALELLKQGKKVTRKGWNGKGLWVSLFKAYTHTPVAIQDCELTFNPMFVIKNTNNKFATWVASSTDLLAEDWEEVE